MRIASYLVDGRAGYGIVDPSAALDDADARVVTVAELLEDAPDDVVGFLADPAAQASAAARFDARRGVPLSTLTLLPTIPRPGNVICIGVNYLDHAIESGMTAAPEYPVIFMKVSSAVAAHGDDIVKPAISSQIDWEAELAVVISRTADRVSEEDALDYVGGYFALNDVSARDYQQRTTQWVQGKSFPTFAPMGPYLLTPDEFGDPQQHGVRLVLGDEVMQDQSTADMIFPVRTLISYLSHVSRLEPGDVIATGTPSGIGASRTPPVFLADGDVVRVEIEGLPTLVNTVRDGD